MFRAREIEKTRAGMKGTRIATHVTILMPIPRKNDTQPRFSIIYRSMSGVVVVVVEMHHVGWAGNVVKQNLLQIPNAQE
jgi:hypothetical protein